MHTHKMVILKKWKPFSLDWAKYSATRWATRSETKMNSNFCFITVDEKGIKWYCFYQPKLKSVKTTPSRFLIQMWKPIEMKILVSQGYKDQILKTKKLKDLMWV